MSDDPPGFNAPRRKARFSSRYEQEQYRPTVLRRSPAEPTPPIEEPEAEEVASTAEGSTETLLPGEAETSVTASGEATTATAENPEDAQDDLLPNFRLNKVYEAPPLKSNPLKDWRWLLLTTLLLAAGLGGGYYLGRASVPAPVVSKVVKEPEKVVVGGLSPELQAQVDAAFQANKKGQYQQARDQFTALYQQHPEWWSMGIEAARTSLYLHEPQATKRSLNGVTADAGQPDVNFIQALLHLTNKELDLAESSFALAVAHDPARPDFFYFWGECLRRDGKPLEAVNKFRAALLRNQYEYAEGLYQLKLWLSQIQANQEEASGTNQAINAALASPRPPYEALFAAAARELKAKQVPKAVEYITRALAVTEPAVFRVIMQDATFTEEAAIHPELTPFYQ